MSGCVEAGHGGAERPERTIEEMIGAASTSLPEADAEDWGRQADGWRRPLQTGSGFRYQYSRDLAEGGWEFYVLNDAVSMAVVDCTVTQSISRLHRHDDHIVFSAVLEGRSAISAFDQADQELARGFCTVYGLAKGAPVRTIYEPGRPLRWVSVFLRRDRVGDLCGLNARALPEIFREYILNDRPLGLRSVPLTSAASMAATQVFECSYTGELRRMYLLAKAIEILCAVMRSFSIDQPSEDRTVFTEKDAEKVRAAKTIIEENLDDPLEVTELARVVGLSRQKLQIGFQLLFNESVGRVYKQVRLARAVSLVSGTNMPMIQVALECGYEHAGSFTRAFKQAFGESPIRIRTMHQQKRSLEKLKTASR